MSAEVLSVQEEALLALLAVEKLGECTAREVAHEMGVRSVERTLWRLEQQGRVVRRMRQLPRVSWCLEAVFRVPERAQ